MMKKHNIIATVLFLLTTLGVQAQDRPTGTLTVTSNKKGASVYVDGKYEGTTPLKIVRADEHNIRVEKDIQNYYRDVRLVTFTPGMNSTINFRLNPIPKTYVFVVGQYSVSNVDGGLLLGVCKKWGVYGRIHFNGSVTEKYTPLPVTFEKEMPVKKLTDPHSFGVAGGAMAHLMDGLYAYAGLGYAEYDPGRYDEDTFIYPFEHKCLTADLGIMYRWRSVVLQLGYAPAISKIKGLTDGDRYGDLNIGLGFTLCKTRKRQQ